MPDVVNAPITITPNTITAPVTIGAWGKSAYQSYLATTADDPVLSEAAWVASLEGATGPAGPNSVTSATTSDGTAILNIAQISVDAPADENAIQGYAEGGGAAVLGQAINGVGVSATSSASTGLTADSTSGFYHAYFGTTGIDQSFVARVDGAFGWLRGSYTGRIKASDTLTGNRTYTLPDASGTIALTSDIPETSTGGNGAADAGKVVEFGSDGVILATQYQFDGGGSAYKYGLVLVDQSNSHFLTVNSSSQTGNREIFFPDDDGTIALTSQIPTQASDVSAARAIETKTGDFTAVVGGRYITESGGNISITDPAGTTAGQSYEVWIGSGTIQFNGAGTSYSASRFSIRRRYTGAAWATPAPTITDTLTVGSGTWSGSAITGAQSFSGQIQLTGQSATDANSAMTRGLADTRYGERVSSYLSADGTPIQSQVSYQDTGISIALGVGTWSITGQFIASNATSGAGLKTKCVTTGGSASDLYGIIATAGNEYGSSSALTTELTIASAGTPVRMFDGIMIVSSATTVKIQYAQNSSTAANTTPRAGSYLTAVRIA